MARIVLATFGTAGDINPFIALGIGLRARGHDVVFAVEAKSCVNVAEAGFAIHTMSGDIIAALGEQMTAHLGANVLKAMRIIVDEYFLPTLRPRVDEMVAACAGADLLIASSPAVAATCAAELLTLPLVILCFTPASVPSASIAPQPLPFRLPTSAQHAINRATWALGRRVSARMLDTPVNQVRTEFGLSPRRYWMDVTGGAYTARLVAVTASPTFCAAPPDWPTIVRETGFLFWDRPSSWRMPEELDTFLAAGEPVVAISCGSMSLELGHRFDAIFREAVAAVHGAGARALVIGAPHGALPDPLPPNVYALPFAPFSEVYPRCAAVIHHGGIGTAAQALRAGAPQLVVPWAIDQFWTGAQVERVGAGRTLSLHRFTATRASELLLDLLQSARYRKTCAALAGQIAAEDGARVLCDAIDNILVTVGQPD